jgi:hypothetical protein
MLCMDLRLGKVGGAGLCQASTRPEEAWCRTMMNKIFMKLPG